jgi:hypothetical protein
MSEDILQEFGLKPNVKRYGDCADFETSIVAQHYFQAVWQKKRDPISLVDSSL